MKTSSISKELFICSMLTVAAIIGLTIMPSGSSGQAERSRATAAAPQELLPLNGTPVICSTPLDFQDGTLQGFTVEPVRGPALWHLTSNICGAQFPGHSGPFTLYYGRDSDCTYLEGTDSASNVISPPIEIPTGLAPFILDFNYLLQVEGGSFDVVFVDISTDDGATWTQVLTKSNLINNGQWNNVARDITPFVGAATSIRVRFRFDTVDDIINSTRGWHIDDIKVCSQPVTFCAQDDASGSVLLLNQETGDYRFFNCRKNVTLDGKGAISTSSCKITLEDDGADPPKTPDRSVLVTINPCTMQANGSISIFSRGETFPIRDNNITNNLCRCP